MREVQNRTAARDTAVTTRVALLARLSEARDERYNLRRAVAAQLSAEIPTLRVSVRQSASLDAYRAFVAEQLKGQRMKQGLAADRIVGALLPTELATLVFAEDNEELAKRAGIDIERARRIVDTLRENGSAYELQTIDLEDVPCIELRDGEAYKEASHLFDGAALHRSAANSPSAKRSTTIDRPARRQSRQRVRVRHGRQCAPIGEAQAPNRVCDTQSEHSGPWRCRSGLRFGFRWPPGESYSGRNGRRV